MQAMIDGRPIEVLCHDSGERVTLEVGGRQYGFSMPLVERNTDGSIPEVLLRAFVEQAARWYVEEVA